MEHENEKQMIFHFLRCQNYNQTSNQLEFCMGYDLGDYSMSKEGYKLAKELAHLLRQRLTGVFDDDGQIASYNPVHEWKNPKELKDYA